MKKYTLSAYERETIISFNLAEDTAEMYTSDPAWIRKMNKLQEKHPEQVRSKIHSTINGGEICAMKYYFPRKSVAVRIITRKLSDEQKQAATKRLQEYKAKNKPNLVR